jgi:ribokinase
MAEVVVFGVVAADVILRVPRIPAPGDHVNAEALGWRVGGSSANVACGLSTAGHHVRLVGPVGSDSMGDQLVAELEQCGVDIEYSFRAGAASPRTLILLDETGRAHHHRGEQRGRAVIVPAGARARSQVS